MNIQITHHIGWLARRVLPLLVMLMAQQAKAQTDAQFSQYFEVPAYYNTAAIGTTDLLKIRGGMLQSRELFIA